MNLGRFSEEERTLELGQCEFGMRERGAGRSGCAPGAGGAAGARRR